MSEEKGFAYWSGYSPGKPGPDPGGLIPLNATELRSEAERFLREAARREVAREPGSDWLRRAAADFERRAQRMEAGDEKLPPIAPETRQQYFAEPRQAAAALLLLSDAGARRGSFSVRAEAQSGRVAVCCGEFENRAGEQEYLVADVVREYERGWRSSRGPGVRSRRAVSHSTSTFPWVDGRRTSDARDLSSASRLSRSAG